MRVGAGMPGSDVDTPGLGLVCEPVRDAIEFFVALEAALALVWHSWDDDAREAAALAGCVPLKANLLDKGPKDWQDEVMALCDCALGSLLAAQDMVEELLHTREVAWAHSTATGSVFVVQAPAESKAKAEVHIVHVLPRSVQSTFGFGKILKFGRTCFVAQIQDSGDKNKRIPSTCAVLRICRTN